MKKSIGDNEIPKGWTFEQGLALIKKAGYDGVELWLGDTATTTASPSSGLKFSALKSPAFTSRT